MCKPSEHLCSPKKFRRLKVTMKKLKTVKLKQKHRTKKTSLGRRKRPPPAPQKRNLHPRRTVMSVSCCIACRCQQMLYYLNSCKAPKCLNSLWAKDKQANKRDSTMSDVEATFKFSSSVSEWRHIDFNFTPDIEDQIAYLDYKQFSRSRCSRTRSVLSSRKKTRRPTTRQR